MINEKVYVPCLPWKQGEYQAVMNLSYSKKRTLIPLIEVPEKNYDFEDKKPPKTIDEHLGPFAKRVKDKWGVEDCFVDCILLDPKDRLSDGQHPARFIFSGLRFKGIRAIPVIGLDRDSDYNTAVREIIATDKRGLCLRINLEEISPKSIQNKIDSILSYFDITVDQCDLIIDLKAPGNFEPIAEFANLIESRITILPYRDSWRLFGIIGTSFPESLAGLPSGVSIQPRYEWQLYKQISSDLEKSGIRKPIYGDYAIHYPKINLLNMKYTHPKAAIRYSIDNEWLIVRGQKIRGKGGVGYGQFRDLCNLVVNSSYFYGFSFSEGDKYIYECAKGQIKPGNLSSWRQVGTNHHLEMVVHDLANLPLT